MLVPEFDENALAVLRERYLWRYADGNELETPQEMLRRVAGAISLVESEADRDSWAEKFYTVMALLDFLPNSPTLMNAGRPNGQLSACYVLGIEDSMESIFTALKHQALIHKSGGGTGFNFSNLRPEGASVTSTNGTASGPVSFMGMFNHATDVVQQGGMRRGANMGILNVEHTDIRKFIKAKVDEGKFTNFNISVGATDSFMFKVLDGDIEANDLFNEIVYNAWKSGDPGMIFLDTINAKNTTPWLGKLEATNPCVTGDTLILTSKGYRRIADCVGEIVEVWNGEEFSEVVPQVTGENQEVMTVSLSNGVDVECTPYHKFLTWEGFARGGKVIKKEAKDLTIGDKLMKFSLPVIEGPGIGVGEELMYINGFYSGDGSWNEEKCVCEFQLYNGKRALLPLFIKYSTFATREHGERVTVHIRNIHMRCKFWVPDAAASIKERLAWLAGLIDSDGTRNSAGGDVTISSVERDFLKDVQLMLTTLGEHTTVSMMKKACMKEMPDGHGGSKEYACKECYRITLSASTITRLKELGLATKRVDISTNPNRDAGRFIKVVGIKRTGKIADKVYCFTEEKNHTGIFNGVLLGQCGETPLYPNEACNLGSINLAHMVKNGKVDWKKLADTVRIAVHFLDNVIDINHFPLKEIEEAVKRTRKIGLGVMGWAEMLFQLGIAYDSDKALSLACEVMRNIQGEGLAESFRLALQRDAYDAEHSIYRNATITCIAPTGTLSLLAGCSSGIEPVFALKHKRIAFAAEDGHQQTLEYYNRYYQNALVDPSWTKEDIKRVFVTSHEIAPKWHVLHQAAFQRYTDLAVSKTINLPHSATRDDVKEAFLLAWVEGCKGVTVYRDGCKTKQVLYASEPEKSGEACPVCGAAVKHVDGCTSCTKCAWGACAL